MGIYSIDKIKEENTYSKHIITEAYYGDSKTIEETFKEFSKLRAKYKGNKGTAKYINDINTSDVCLDFNRSVEKAFGFKRFAFIVEPGTEFNAYVIPMSTKIDIDTFAIGKHIETNKDGIRFKKNMEFNSVIYMTSSLFLNKEFTDREVFAIFLHEMGHHFQGSLSDSGVVFSYYGKIINVISILYNLSQGAIDPTGMYNSIDGLQKVCMEKAEEMRKNNSILLKIFYNAKGIVAAIMGTITDIMIAISSAISIVNPFAYVITNLYRKVLALTNPIAVFKLIFGYGSEQTADTFCTVYGYGSDLSSALVKMDDLGAGYNSLKIINNTFLINLIDLYTVLSTLVVLPLDEHPNTIARIQDQLDYLNNELKTASIDPAMKIQIKKEIKELEDLINKITSDYDIIGGLKDNRYIRNYFNGILLNLLGGDIRRSKNQARHEKRFKQFNDALKNVKLK